MGTIAEVFAANMRARRKRLDLTQEELAERSGLSKITIQQVETCNIWFGKDTVAAIAKALETTETALFQIAQDESLASIIAVWDGLNEKQRGTVADVAEGYVNSRRGHEAVEPIGEKKKA